MGHNGLDSLLGIAGLEAYRNNPPPNNMDRDFDFADISALFIGLEEQYGTRGGRGMALKIGRASFAHGIKQFGIMRGIADPAFQTLPLDHRVELGLKALSAVFTNFTDQESIVEVKPDALLFHVETCPMAWGRVADRPVCHAMVGIIQESLRWSSNGYEFLVKEIACRATGSDACIFQINKTAIGGRS